jgi:alpha-mannosidase
VRRVESLNAPPIVREVEAHPGEWPAAATLVQCASPNVILTVVKVAEEGEDLILRGYETAGRESQVEIRFGLDDARWTVAWKAYEIKTLRLEVEAAALVEVSMLEEIEG